MFPLERYRSFFFELKNSAMKKRTGRNRFDVINSIRLISFGEFFVTNSFPMRSELIWFFFENNIHLLYSYFYRFSRNFFCPPLFLVTTRIVEFWKSMIGSMSLFGFYSFDSNSIDSYDYDGVGDGCDDDYFEMNSMRSQ